MVAADFLFPQVGTTLRLLGSVLRTRALYARAARLAWHGRGGCRFYCLRMRARAFVQIRACVRAHACVRVRASELARALVFLNARAHRVCVLVCDRACVRAVWRRAYREAIKATAPSARTYRCAAMKGNPPIREVALRGRAVRSRREGRPLRGPWAARRGGFGGGGGTRRRGGLASHLTPSLPRPRDSPRQAQALRNCWGFRQAGEPARPAGGISQGYPSLSRG